MRMDGVQVSSNCPDFTAQTKAARNPNARVKLMKMSRKMTSMAKCGMRSAECGILR